ncbi:MAG TPA: anaerobic glycerol-3-phosphate dehydrogenase subunit B [Anaerolineales bacterium]|nr:anaerobic glycerol-3-phosphate dehydrogenase subunit B [Anaerolineales bacterium]
MSPTLLIVGQGLTGLFSAVLAARRGATVRLIAEGRGGLSLSHGCVDIWRNGDIRFARRSLGRGHPLSELPREVRAEALSEFLQLAQEARLPYVAAPDRVLRLPTALGSVHVTAAAPYSLAAGSLDDPTPFHLGRIGGLRDFSADLATSAFRARGVNVAGTIDLPVPARARDLYAHDLARLLEDPGYRESLYRDWTPHMKGVTRLGLPAILGGDHSLEVFTAMEQRLGVSLFEIPTLPPSLPGLRLERALRRLAVASGVEVIEGPSVRGEVDGRSAGRRVSGVVATTAGGPRVFRSQAVLLATGGALHGGWMSFANGEVQDSVFGLPLEAPEDREDWTAPSLFESQPFSRFGLRLDSRRRPCDRRGRPYFENLYAAGGILGGADRSTEGCRQGIDLASAYAAVEAALA